MLRLGLIISFSLSLVTPSSAATAQPPTYQFAIPPGPVAVVVAAFSAVTGATVRLPPVEGIGTLPSPGVSGEYTAEQALEQLLVGTALGARRSVDQTGTPASFTLELRLEAERVEVTGRAVPYRPGPTATATKTLTALRDIPQTLTVLPRELLADQNAQSLAAAMKNVPGVTVAQGEGNRDQVVIRGISTASDFFVNGVRDDQERFRDLYNVQSVEVLQGPAAVLFGRGGAGGVVNLVTARPARQTPSEVVVSAGAFDHKRVTGQVGGGLNDKVAYRMSLMTERSGGFRDAFFLDRYAVNPTIAFDLGPSTTLTAGFEHLSDHRLADRGIPSQDGRPLAVAANQLFGSARQNDARSGNDTASLTFEHRFSPRLLLRNSFLSGRYDKRYQNVYPGSAVSSAGTFSLAAYNHQVDRTNTFNQTDLIYDGRIAGMTHTLLAGTEFGHQFQDELRHTASNIPNVTIATSVRDADFDRAPVAFDRHATSNIAAVYVQDQITLGAGFKAVVGARRDRFAVRVDDRLPVNLDLSRTDAATSPRAGVIYQPNRIASIYSSYSYTFLPSGQTLGLAANTAQLTPENARNYELGTKLDLLGQRLNVSAAVFRLDRNNVKNTDPNDPARLVLTGQQRTEGVTVSAAGSLLPKWTLVGGYSFLNGRIMQNTTAAPAGRLVGLVPRSQFNVWSTYDLSDRWGGGGGIVRQAKMFASFSNQVELPGFTRIDAVVYYRVNRYRLALNAENLLDTRYYSTANGDNNISPGTPRNLQLSVRVMF
jgi:catecholate siderophore receptor